MLRLLTIALVGICSFSSCHHHHSSDYTQEEIRNIQTYVFDTNDHRRVTQAIIKVLEDQDYLITDANLDLGTLSASKSTDIENEATRVFSKMLMSEYASWKQQRVRKCSADVAPFGPQVKVRMRFQQADLDNHGKTEGSQQLVDLRLYDRFFAEVNERLFLIQTK